MNCHIIHDSGIVGLIGGGPVTADLLDAVISRVSKIAAADGGAGHLVYAGKMPDAVIGDFDSLSPALRAELPDEIQHHIAEQDSTDFEKCLTRINAGVILAAGFCGGRLDHELAALHGLMAWPDKPCVLLGEEDILFLAPPQLTLPLAPGVRVSLMPLAQVRAVSDGLLWPLEGREFAPGIHIGTSNEVAGTGPEDTDVTLNCDAPAMLVILPRETLDTVITALAPPVQTKAAVYGWSARTR